MKKLRNILSITIALLFMSISVVPSFASPATPYEYLLNCGYSEEFLNSASEELIYNIYNAIGDNKVTNVKEVVMYLDESGIPYLPNTLGAIDANSLKIIVNIQRFAEIILMK